MTRDDLELVATAMERAARANVVTPEHLSILLPLDELPAGLGATVTGLRVPPGYGGGAEYVCVFLADLRGWLAATAGEGRDAA